jgi:hypothetical protein
VDTVEDTLTGWGLEPPVALVPVPVPVPVLVLVLVLMLALRLD